MGESRSMDTLRGVAMNLVAVKVSLIVELRKQALRAGIG